MIEVFLKAFFSIFVIMNVLGNVPLFLSLSSKLKKKQKNRSINKAILIAGIILLIFLFLGDHILNFFGISIHSFKVAGGIILLIVAIEMVLGLQFKEKRYDKYEFATFPLATPLITGPGVIATIILLVQSAGLLITLAASILNLFLTWVFLRFSVYIYKFLGRQGSDVLSRVMGLILAAISIEFIKSGWIGIV